MNARRILALSSLIVLAMVTAASAAPGTNKARVQWWWLGVGWRSCPASVHPANAGHLRGSGSTVCRNAAGSSGTGGSASVLLCTARAGSRKPVPAGDGGC
jgi:hypothetical protein